jgi:cob(I)alamin adenosyltransferase
MIHIYYGDGKGKTTAALGLILRAAGAGLKCVIVQFLKDFQCAELDSLGRLGVTVLRGKAPGKAFTRDMSPDQLSETARIHNENLDAATEMLRSGQCDVLVLDEALDALRLGLLDEAKFHALIENPPENAEIVITGHQMITWVTERADYITEMRKHAHPYDKGVQARKGIEF